MTIKEMDVSIKLLLDIYDQAYNKKAWHGTTLRGSLRGLTLEQVLWRPGAKRHNIWELVLHCAYWKYVIRRRLTEDKELSFARKGSDWIPLPSTQNEANWKKDLKLLNDEHNKLREVLENFSPSRLYYIPPGCTKVENINTIYGISSHDLYHAGQIQLIKRLQKARP